MYARPKFDNGETTTLGVSGMLWRDALVMYDRRSKSLWSQIDGEAKAGPSTGESLRKIPSQMTTWANWRARHPHTLVLVKPPLDESVYEGYHEKASWVGIPGTRGGGDERLPKKTLVLGVDLSDHALAVHLGAPPDGGLHQKDLGDVPLLVVIPEDPRAALVYERRVRGKVESFEWSPPDGDSSDAERVLIDATTGSRWDWRTGEAVQGSLVGERLRPVAASPIYWATWTAFYPQTEVW